MFRYESKKVAEKIRFTWYGFVQALKRAEEGRATVVGMYTEAAVIEVLLIGGEEEGWGLQFRHRDYDPFWLGMKEEVDRMKEEEGETKPVEPPPKPTPDPLASFGPREGETEEEWYERTRN